MRRGRALRSLRNCIELVSRVWPTQLDGGAEKHGVEVGPLKRRKSDNHETTVC